MPTNSVPRMIAIHIKVVAAFFADGLRNAGTPSAMASTPVSATAPDEKPFRMRNRPSAPPASAVPSKASGSNGTCDDVAQDALDDPDADEAVSITM